MISKAAFDALPRTDRNPIFADASLAPLAQEAIARARELQATVYLVWTEPATAADPIAWLQHFATCPSVYWKGRYASSEYAAAGAVLQIHADGPDALTSACAQAEATLSRHVVSSVSSPVLQPRFFGGFAFDPARRRDALWTGYDDAHLILPEAVYIRDSGSAWLLLTIPVEPGDAPEGVVRSSLAIVRKYMPVATPAPLMPLPKIGDLEPLNPPAESGWTAMVQHALDRVSEGTLNKVVLARRLRLRSKANLPRWPVMARLRDMATGCFHFAFSLRHDRAFLGATPERLFYRDKANLETECIAGTIGRGNNSDADQSLAMLLLASEKDRREHDYVIEDMLHCLGDLCERLDASTAPRVVKLPTLQHLLTTAHGRLREAVTLGEILDGLHPTPAVGGFPRETALAAIRELEHDARGWYAGPVGWIARDQAEFAVAIRSAMLVEREAVLFAGAGIVAGSIPEREWRETEDKARAFLKALS